MLDKMLSKEKIIKEVLKLNPWMKEEELQWRMYSQLEWICPHGIGHYVFSPDNFYSHGCDGCCKKLKVLANVVKK